MAAQSLAPTEPRPRPSRLSSEEGADASAAIEAALAVEVGSANPTMVVHAAAAHLVLAPGAKRARPRLIVALGESLGASRARLVDASVAVELVHCASLLHDDVVDEGDVRRGRPTVNVHWGNSVAVLVGDYLLARALPRMASASQALLPATFDVLSKMSSAAVLEVQARGNVTLAPDEWRAIAAGKTGALFGLCGHAGGLLGGDRAVAERLESAARGLGQAFQMQDDLHDLVDAASVQSDLRQRTPSYPLTLAVRASEAFRRRLDEAWSAGGAVEAAAAVELAREVLAGTAVDDTLRAIGAEVSAARTVLATLPASPAISEIIVWASALGRDPREGTS